MKLQIPTVLLSVVLMSACAQNSGSSSQVATGPKPTPRPGPATPVNSDPQVSPEQLVAQKYSHVDAVCDVYLYDADQIKDSDIPTGEITMQAYPVVNQSITKSYQDPLRTASVTITLNSPTWAALETNDNDREPVGQITGEVKFLPPDGLILDDIVSSSISMNASESAPIGQATDARMNPHVTTETKCHLVGTPL